MQARIEDLGFKTHCFKYLEKTIKGAKYNFLTLICYNLFARSEEDKIYFFFFLLLM